MPRSGAGSAAATRIGAPGQPSESSAGGATRRAGRRPSSRWDSAARSRGGSPSRRRSAAWNRGSTAVSIFSTVRTTRSISRRASPESSAISAPVPAAFPAGADAVQGRVGDEPEHERVERVDLAPERAGELDPVDRLDPEVVHQESRSRVERGLGELDRADVVLGDRRRGDAGRPRRCRDPPRAALVEHVRERPAVRARCAATAPPSSPSIAPSAVITPARNSSAMTSTMPEPQMPVTPVRRVDASEPDLVGPAARADDAEARLERLPVDPHPLDRAGRGPLAAGDLGALEGRPGRARTRRAAARASRARSRRSCRRRRCSVHLVREVAASRRG